MNKVKIYVSKLSKKKKIFYLICFLIFCVGLYNNIRTLPAGVNLEGSSFKVSEDSIAFFKDVSFLDNSGVRQSEQEIFDEVISMIDGANQYIVLDMFLFNDFLGVATSSYRQLSKEVTEALVKKKQENSDMIIQVISDPLNTMYGESESEYFSRLEQVGISVTITDLKKLRDSNPLYSAFWRSLLQWIPQKVDVGIFPNALDPKKSKVDIQTYINILNFKANHRKLLIADYERDGRVGISVLATSANPHDGSSAHGNSALRVDDFVWRDAIRSEQSVVEFSGANFTPPPSDLINALSEETGDITVQFLTERAIKEKILNTLNSLGTGDSLDMAMFYISDRNIISALKEADKRGVKLRLLFDANKDAFGREKNGIPNRPIANELVKHSNGNTEVRWCNTHGEQCHSKMLIFSHGDSRTLILGSANLTRRNLDNYNLETDILVEGVPSTTSIKDAQAFFDSQWLGEKGRSYSLPYETYADSSLIKTLEYRLFEFTGMSNW
ncbi:phospholipase [Candidatus Nomurabacteria bacterium]|nr:phospholipase [Candidatus Kaiserbacteria bacterium]MCB9814099.1 phospholipase [Candidatus Nomurabacteria bacterium]